jgi:Flp pilus assembly protein TadG
MSRVTHMSRGAALVEFAILVPLMLTLLIGLMEAGRLGDYAIKIANAARAGVQYGAQNGATASDTQGMQNAAGSDAGDATITSVAAATFCACADGTASSCQQGDCPTSHRLQWVSVTSSGTFTAVIGSSFLPSQLRSLSISQTATMRVAQ